MIANYIQELLATNNRVIVPNYGAFLVRATSKSKDANTLAEKLKDVYFSPFLKFNDELLEKYIIKKESITKEQAAEKITSFINDVKKELEAEKPYKIEGFGEFVADKQGKVQFLTLAKGVEEKETTKKAAKKPEKETKAATAKKAVTKSSEKKEKPKVEEKKTEDTPVKKEEKPAVPSSEKETKSISESSKLKEFKQETKQAPETTSAKSIYSKKEKKPINKGLVWAIALGLPFAAIFIWGLLNFSTVKKIFEDDISVAENTSNKKKEEKKKPVIKINSDSTKVEVQEEKKPEVKKAAIPQKKYYIIAGSFKNEKYAFSYMNKLKAEGYNAEKLDERNGMHAVSFNSFTDERKAIAEYKYLSTEKGLQAWILYH